MENEKNKSAEAREACRQGGAVVIAPVDVLAVMDKCHSSLECGGLRHSLSEARAAVAELIEAVSAGAEVQTHNGSALKFDEVQSFRLAAALARVKGGEL